MQLKELTLKELLALFDASAHEQIAEYFDDPGIHYIVVFANHFQPDMGLLTVGPEQDCTSLEQAKRAIIDRKFAKFMVRCAGCPKDARKNETVVGLVKPIERGTQLEPVRASAAAPVASGRQAAPEAVTPRVVFSPGGSASKESPSKPAAAPAPSAAPVAAAAVVSAATAPAAEPVAMSAEEEARLAARAAELDKREAALKGVEAELKQREDEIVEREDYVTESEESLIGKLQKQERRAVELEQQEENLRKGLAMLAAKEAAFAAKVEAFKAANPTAEVS